MQVVESVNLLPPSICIICESYPPNNGETVVDTLLTLRTGVASALNGRKYVCERCVIEFANLYGFERGDQIQKANFDRDVADRKVSLVRQRVEALLESLKDSIGEEAIAYEGASYEDLFTPPDVEAVRTASANRLSAVESRGVEPVAVKTRKKREHAPVASPPVHPQDEAITEGEFAQATIDRVKAEKESNGSSGSKS